MPSCRIIFLPLLPLTSWHTERNFEMMSGKYQKEQLEIEARLKEVTETLNDSYEKSQGVRDFLSLIRNYQGLKELDATIINALIDKILVSEREKLADGTVRQEIKIYYKFIGFVGELHITPTKRWTALKPKNYYRDLNLERAVATTRYQVDGVNFQREVFASIKSSLGEITDIFTVPLEISLSPISLERVFSISSFKCSCL